MSEIYSKTMRSKYQRKMFERVRYQLITVYYECISKSVGSNDMAELLATAAINLRDPACEAVEIWDFETREFVLHYWKDESQ